MSKKEKDDERRQEEDPQKDGDHPEETKTAGGTAPVSEKEDTANEEKTELESMAAEFRVLENKMTEQTNILLRTAAEFDNYKKRTEREREQLADFVRGETIKAILPAVDNLDRALAADPGGADYIKGVEMTIRQLFDALTKLGLTRIDEAGVPFDPNRHEAVMHAEEEGGPENTVKAVLQKGYMLGPTVLRHAMVSVIN